MPTLILISTIDCSFQFASGELQKFPAALNICEHETLPPDLGTVGETLEAVGFPAPK